MNLQQHTVSLETAKRMKELGWDKDTIFYYVPTANGCGDPSTPYIFTGYIIGTKKCYIGLRENYPAPLLSEILTELPIRIHFTKEGCRHIQITRDMRGYSIWYTKKHYTNHQNPAEAAGQLWCALKKEGII